MGKETKRKVVAASLSAEEFKAMEDLCIDLRIRQNSVFLREAVREMLAKHGKVASDAATESQ